MANALFYYTCLMHPELKAGKVLVSHPYVQDGEFNRSVVLLSSYSEKEVMGFILNKPTDIMVHEVFEEFPEFNALVYIGGPVDQNLLFFLHTLGPKIPNSVKVKGDVYFGGDFETVRSLIESGELTAENIRFFVGYSGWGQGQLEEEIDRESWFIGNFQKKFLFTLKHRLMWPSLLKKIDPKMGVYADYPFTPSLN